MSNFDKLDRSMDHAWKYFELHAQQRMTVFNFFLAIAGLIAAGIGVGLQVGGGFSALVSLLGCFLSLVSLIFWRLDQRVSAMIKLAEGAIVYLEGLGVAPEAAIFTRELNSKNSNGGVKIWTYGRCFRVSFLIVGAAGFAFAILPCFFLFS